MAKHSLGTSKKHFFEFVTCIFIACQINDWKHYSEIWNSVAVQNTRVKLCLGIAMEFEIYKGIFLVSHWYSKVLPIGL